MTSHNERYWINNPNYTAQQAQLLDTLYFMWVANGRQGVFLEGSEPLEVLNTPDDNEASNGTNPETTED